MIKISPRRKTVHRSDIIDKQGKRQIDKSVIIQTWKFIDNQTNIYTGRNTNRQDRERNSAI